MIEEKTLRIGIPLIGGKVWMGGVCYIELLVKALSSLPEPERPELYLILNDVSLSHLEVHEAIIPLFKEIIFVGDIQKDHPDFYYTKSHQDLMNFLDFYFPLMNGAWPSAKVASWIPDFQHHHLPHFFDAQELKSRDASFGSIANEAALLVLSSRDAQQDFNRFYPNSKAVTRVLSFYALPQPSWYGSDYLEIQKLYRLPDEFLICCNQFWAHKNHAVLFEAIARLHRKGIDMHVACTGHTDDYRAPGYFAELKALLQKLGIEHLIHILGNLPRHHQIQLVRRSLAVVQPSLFEGWSTVVEDCRALGKTMILSDLPVNKEQAPRYGVFFERSDSEALARVIEEMLPLSPGPDRTREQEAAEEAKVLVASFARCFTSIVRESKTLAQKPAPAEEEGTGRARPVHPGGPSAVTEQPPRESVGSTGSQLGEEYLVSAIVSTYNAERFFRGCLENLLRQTLYHKGELEIIIIDSGSQQNEEGIAREFMAGHPHIVYRRTGHETLYAAWNRGIALARGRFLTHANTDDRHRADAFETMARELDRSKASLAYIDALMTCGENETFEENSAAKKWLLPDFDLRQALLDCPFGCQVMWRADAHREVGTFDAGFKRAGDYEFFLRLALRKGALHIPQIAALYHESINNLSYQAPQEVIREVRGFIGSLRSGIPLEEIYPYLKEDPSPAARVAALVDFGNLLMGASGSLFTDIPLAERCYGKALQLAPGNREAVDNLAVAAMAQGKLEAALAAIALGTVKTPRLKRYLDELNAGRIPGQLDLLRIPHPGLDAMPPVKLLEQIRVPLPLNEKPGCEAPRTKAPADGRAYPTVVVDGVFFMTPKTGITRVWVALLKEWARTEFGKSVLVLDRIGTAPRIPGLNYRTVPAYDVRPEGWDRAMLQKVCDEEAADLFISTYYSSPLTTPSLFLSHDMIPELSGLYDLQDAQWREKRHAMERASAFVSVSRSTARHMEMLHPELAGRIEVAHCGIDRDLFRPASEEEKTAFRKRHGMGKPFFLFVGKRTEHKNGRLLFQAFSRLPDRERLAILCVGGAPELEPELAELAAGSEVRLVNLDDAELRIAYGCAEALVYPSTHEGFGLPLLEAMACRCPVITCRNSSIPEVAGDAPLYVDPGNAGELAAALQQVRIPQLRSELIKLGDHQVGRFSWEKMARTFQEIICRRFAPAAIAASPAATGAKQVPAPAGTTGMDAARPGPAQNGNSTRPKISLVIPSYNYGHFLEACLDSILSQNYPNLELIVMDGGSRDNTVEILKRYERHIAYWRSHPDAGNYGAIEEGLNRSSGEIMTWLNADDMFHEGAFDLAARIFTKAPEVEWLMGRPNSFDEEGRQKHVCTFLPMNSRGKYLADEELIQQEGVFWRRGLWERSGAYIEKSLLLAADLELWARFFRSARLFSVDTLIAGFRDHPLQKSKDKAGYTAEANRVLAREREIFAQEGRPFTPPAPFPILVEGDEVIL